MRNLEYTASAEADLAGIVRTTIDSWGAAQAAQYLDGLEQLTGRLLEHPALGAACGDIAGGLRAFPYQSHIVYYRAEPERLVVIRVLHRRMDPQRHIQGADKSNHDEGR